MIVLSGVVVSILWRISLKSPPTMACALAGSWWDVWWWSRRDCRCVRSLARVVLALDEFASPYMLMRRREWEWGKVRVTDTARPSQAISGR